MAVYNGDNNYYPKKIDNINYTDESFSDWEKYRNTILQNLTKSQDDFEKYLNIFSSGGLFICLTILSKLIEKEVYYQLQFFIIFASILFLISLLLNLFSHYIAISNDEKNIIDIDNQCEVISENIDKRNKVIVFLNRGCVSSITLATLMLSIFLILNIKTMSKKEYSNKDVPKGANTNVNPRPLNDEKGRTTTKPSFQIKPKK
ncbi:hypothetical protein [Chryseobacterium sp. Leaf201]|uniref:hypothetical protein n=1 Tax=Chryseobacterium sp. Leaf201 TaxID=1735672 RepID=UPI0007007DD0|nr:hypothetical protein [Chryseobacterium sp. Leaf201]KQM57976.1 hypothetical protein ASE55_19205 [Chryseobacterium sp. Leaf201]